jgi:hypothetical protein
MATVIKRLSICIILSATFLITGCMSSNTIYKVPDVSLKNQVGDFIIDKKIDLVINLCVTDKLKATTWENNLPGGYFLIPIGGQLAKNSIEVSELLFKNVVVSNNSAYNGPEEVDAILTPQVITIERTLAGSALTGSILLVVLEWKLEDTKGNVIWIGSIKGEGRAEQGNIYNHKKKAAEQIEMLLKDLFSKSFQAMKSSPAITQFIEKNQLQQD